MSYQKQINTLLMDGRYHDFESIFMAVRRYIDPKVADAEYRKRHDNWKLATRNWREEKGKRRLVILHLISMKARGQVEGRGPAGEQKFRMTKEAIKRRLKRQLVTA